MTLSRRSVLALAAASSHPLRRGGDALDARKLDDVFATARRIDRLTSLAVYQRGKLVRQMKLGGREAYLGWGFGRQYLIIVPAAGAVVTLTSLYDVRGPEEHHRAVASLIDPGLGDPLRSAPG